MLRAIRREFPALHIHGFSPAEIVHFSKLWRLPAREVLRRLKEAGLDSLPGGGAEILVDRARRIVSPRKAAADEWLDCARQAHAAGLKGSCTMVIGHVETHAERIEHLERVRQLQDRTGGLDGVWVAFIVWTMQPRHTALEGRIEPAGATEYLRMLAVARLYLDNIPHMQASWPTQGPKIGQLSFLYGANDWGGLMMEENVLKEAGTVHRMDLEQMRRLSAELGLELRKRDFYYRLLG
jgi:cyclic dehypoxanthinyl futalosine synthase